ATADGTATAGSDYVAQSGTLTFPAGTTTQTISVVVNGDGVVEGDETFVVTLSGAPVTKGQGIGTIVNDDGAPAITSRSPAPGAAGVAVGSPIDVGFTRAMD